MDDALKSDTIRRSFRAGEVFTKEDLRIFYRKQGDENLNENTLLSRIYGLKKKGIISSTERGRFLLGARPDLGRLKSKKHDELLDTIHSELPHVRCTIWELSALMQLVGLEPRQNLVFVETEKEACESVFELLRPSYMNLFVKPDEQVLSRYASMHVNPLIIKPLISEAPLDKIRNRTLPSLEKLCVDMMVEPLYFHELKGQVYRDLVKKLFADNIMNQSALRRYASRRGCRAEIETLLHKLNISIG